MADIFSIPEFLQKHDEDEIQKEMFELIPDKYDKSEGQHYYNFTRPTARIASQIRGFDIPEALKLIWPNTSYGEYLDRHAERENIFRKAAQYAVGKIVISGKAGLTIPAGYIVSTETKNDVISKDYVTIKECIIGENGTVEVDARASVAGKNGNTAANTIVINTSSFEDVTGITNPSAFTGGIDEESDEELWKRLDDYYKTQGDSFIGNPSDYKHWAESIEGTGTAKVIRATDNSGLVTIILTDGNGEPATTELCEKVYNYIMSPNDENTRIAPCGAVLKVIPPTTTTIKIRATVELKSGTIETLTNTFLTNVKEYFSKALEDREILYHKIGNILGDIEGVYDFRGLYINDGAVNIPLADGVYPTINSDNITFVLA